MAEKRILLDESKWQAEPIRKQPVRELIEMKTPQVLKVLPDGGDGWQFHCAFLSRNGFTEAARGLANENDAQLVELTRLDHDLLQA